MSNRRLAENRWQKYELTKNNGGGADSAAVQTPPEMPAEPVNVPKLGTNEERVLRFVAKYNELEGRGPIYDDVFTKFGGNLSRADVSVIISALMGMKFLNKDFVGGTYGLGDIGTKYLASHMK